MNWQGVVLPAAIALITALAAGWFQRPKVKADVRSAETADEIRVREMRVVEQQEALKSAWAATADARLARDEAIAARNECQAATRRIIEASDNLADAVQALIDEPNDIAVRQAARLRLREYRQAI
jgi:hypothetical protein